jgi:hypothetical protein
VLLLPKDSPPASVQALNLQATMRDSDIEFQTRLENFLRSFLDLCSHYRNHPIAHQRRALLQQSNQEPDHKRGPTTRDDHECKSLPHRATPLPPS